MSVNPEELEGVLKAVEKQYGKNTAHRGSDFDRVPRIPFTSLELNVATGGGIPMGRISRIFGDYSAGKTLTSLGVIKNAQNINIIAEQYLESKYDAVKRRGERILELFPDGMKVAYYNAEQVWDTEFAAQIGVNTEDVLVIEGSRIEQIGSIIEATLGSVHVHVIDSISNCFSVDEINSEIEDWHRGIKARAWNKALDHIQDKTDGYENSVIGIDQVRVDQSPMGTEMAAGGKKMGHASSMTIHMKRGKWLFKRDGVLRDSAQSNPDTLSGSPEADGFEVMARVTKSRVGRPFRVARMQIDFDSMSYNQEYELAKAATWLGVVKQSGAWIEIEGEEEKIHGQAKLQERIKEDPKFRFRIQDEIERHITENP